MPTGTPGVNFLDLFEDLERRGISLAWLGGGAGMDNLTFFAAAAMRTREIVLGTAITRSSGRHPLAMVEQVQGLAQLAPGRFRLGIGPDIGAGCRPDGFQV
jgi:alkanesulfonate monooxygenase SsuD/methylene tetrahydromethanopterin reductase-like flavin-dependent oxidoreductase (luciferase family)